MSPTQADARHYLRLPWPAGRSSDIIFLIIGLEADIAADYQREGSSRRTGARYGISAPMVAQIVRAMGGSVRGRGGRNNLQKGRP